MLLNEFVSRFHEKSCSSLGCACSFETLVGRVRVGVVQESDARLDRMMIVRQNVVRAAERSVGRLFARCDLFNMLVRLTAMKGSPRTDDAQDACSNHARAVPRYFSSLRRKRRPLGMPWKYRSLHESDTEEMSAATIKFHTAACEATKTWYLCKLAVSNKSTLL